LNQRHDRYKDDLTTKENTMHDTMQELFILKENFTVEINKPWTILIPEFNAIIKADKGSPGDSEGRAKAKARKIFAYIYFMINFKSPIEQWDYAERHEEAMRYASLTEADVSSPMVKAALDKYEEIQFKSARALRTLKAAEKGLDALDEYLNTVDFKQTDKQGKLLHSPKEFVGNLSSLNKAYDERDKFRNRVYEELKESTTIRGQATLGDKEHKHDGRSAWDEGSAPVEKTTSKLMTDLTTFVNLQQAEGEENKEV
jgi:hypothetical protein